MKRILILILILISSFAHASSKPLATDKAFQLHARVLDANTLLITWDVHPGYFLYRERLHFTNASDDTTSLGKLHLPAGETRRDPSAKTYQIFNKHLEIRLPVLGLQTGTAKIHVDYQGCSESGFCYPPTRKDLLVTFSEDLSAYRVEVITPSIPSILSTPVSKAEKVLTSYKIGWIILSFYGFGLLLAFTPCVLPMIPILSGIIVGQKKLSTRHAFLLSLTYVLGMSLTYALAGMGIALLGSNVQASLQTPFVITLSAAMFALLALSMFGLFEIKIPQRFQKKLADASQRQTSGTYVGVALMGCISTLVLSPCVTAPLVGALSFIAHTGNASLGGMALFTLGLGMGTPLLLIGTAGGKLIPKTGPWMMLTKYIIGILFLGIAIYLLDRILPGQVIMLLWASLFIITSVFLGVFNKTTDHASEKFGKGLGIVFLVYGIAIIIGLGMGNQQVLLPLAELSLGKTSNTVSLPYKKIQNVDHLQQVIANAKGKPILIDYYADWCLSCKVMERKLAKNADIQTALKNWLLLKVDVSHRNSISLALEKHFNVIAPPTYIFFDKHGNEMASKRIIGETSLEKFLEALKEG